jgi:hypothetical protein
VGAAAGPVSRDTPKALRLVLAIIAALVAWAVVATLINLVLRVTIPGYRSQEMAVSFSLVAQIARLAMGLVATAAAAIAALAASRGMLAAPIVAGLVLLALFIPVHVSLWSRFPPWYHLFFLASLPIGSYLFAKLWQSRRHPARAPT